MASARETLDSIRASIGGLTSRVPFLKHGSPSTPEPFSTIEDDTPLGDLLSSRNAAPVAPATKASRTRPELRVVVESALGRRSVLIGILSGLAILLIVAVVALVVAAPPKPIKVAKPFTQAGETLVKSWLPPPGDPLEPRVELERQGLPKYTAADAAKIAKPEDPGVADSLAEKNDEAIEELYGTVP